MNFSRDVNRDVYPLLYRFILMMKITVFLTIAFLSQAVAETKAQKITLSARNVTLQEVMHDVQQQQGYSFFFLGDEIAKTRVNVEIKQADLAEAMAAILAKKKLDWSIEDQTIIIKHSIPSSSVEPFPFLPNPSKSQQRLITGQVVDENNNPLEWVTIQVKGTNVATTTDGDGRYEINIPNNQTTLIYTLMGFEAVESIIGSRSVINISLKMAISDLDEVVVVGYGTQKKANLTGAVSSVNMDEILGNRPVSTTGALLQGVVPGLQVNISSGEPGVSKGFNIRGGTDINTSGNQIRTQGPFILIDNVPFNGPFNLIDPNDIESVTVLKDAGSAAIYGARSAFGVILVTTKQGVKNQKTNFNYSNNLTLSAPMSLPEKATVLQTIQSYQDMGTTGYWTGNNVNTWLELAKEYAADPQSYPEGYAEVEGIRYSLAETNAFENLLGSNSRQFMHNFAVAGGTDKTTYRISMGTVNENGLLAPETGYDKYNRYNLKSVVSTDIKEWFNVQLDMSYYNSLKSYPGGDGLNSAVNLAPWVPMDDSLTVNGSTYPANTPRNAVIVTSPTLTRFDDIRMTGRAILKPLSGLTITGEYTFDNLRNLTTSYNKVRTIVDPRRFIVNTNGTGEFGKRNEITDYKSVNIFANYEKSFDNHNLSAMAGYNQEESSFEQTIAAREGVISVSYPSITQATGIPIASDSYNEYALFGFFGRLNYDYAEKYLIGITGRYDASSKFPENHRSGFFPSVSFGWSVDKENFMSGTSGWLNQFKPRIGYGTVGNQNINTYAFLPNMSASYAVWLHNNTQQTTLSSPDLISSGFTWATVQTLNIGLDVAFLKNRLSANLDWFRRNTKDMLYQGIQLPAVLGTGAPLQNVADMNSEGFEVQINWRDRIGNVSYRIAANLSDYQSTITRIRNEAGLLSQYYEGQQLGEIWGYTTDRLFTPDDFEAGSLNENLINGTLKPNLPRIEGQRPNPGDVMFIDYDGNGIINAGSSTLSNPGDRRIIGNSTPRFQYGVNGGFTWKSLDFSFVISGVAKQDQWRANTLTFPNFSAFGTIYSHQLDYWTISNQDAHWGRMYDQAGGNQDFNQSIQTKYLLNGAYLRIRNLSLGYTLPKYLTQRFFVDRLQAFLSVENAFTFDHMPKGLEADIYRDNEFGYAYPHMRSFSLGVNLSF